MAINEHLNDYRFIGSLDCGKISFKTHEQTLLHIPNDAPVIFQDSGNIDESQKHYDVFHHRDSQYYLVLIISVSIKSFYKGYMIEKIMSFSQLSFVTYDFYVLQTREPGFGEVINELHGDQGEGWMEPVHSFSEHYIQSFSKYASLIFIPDYLILIFYN